MKLQVLQLPLVSIVGEEFLNHFIYHNFACDKLIHLVNNLCTGSEHTQRSKRSLDFRKKLLLDIQGQVKPREVKIPVHQYLFDILVKNQIKSSAPVPVPLDFNAYFVQVYTS